MRLIDLEKVYESACAGCTRHGDALGECYHDEPCERLIFAFTTAEPVEAVVFPCKIGDPVWFVGTSTANRLNKGVIETSVEKLVLKKGGVYMKLACNAMYETSCKSIGKTVFFTQEEAEAALAKMKGGEVNGCNQS